MFKKLKHKVCNNPEKGPDGNRLCPKAGQPQPKGLVMCDCGFRLESVNETNMAAVLGATVAGLALAGALGYFVVLPQISGLIPGFPPVNNSPELAKSGLQYAIETEDGLIDEKKGVPSGGRIRFRLKSGAKPTHFYVFYENKERNQMELVDAQEEPSETDDGAEVTIPGSAKWIRFDENPGQEGFLVMAVPERIEIQRLDRLSRPEFSREMDEIAKRVGRAEVSRKRSGEWVQLVPRDKKRGLMQDRLEVKHQ